MSKDFRGAKVDCNQRVIDKTEKAAHNDHYTEWSLDYDKNSH